MSESASGVRSISDTARWVAYFRALETKRPDALFRDPYAERLAGEQGEQIANALGQDNKQEWAWVARTYLFDKFISRVIEDGAQLVLNLAAGLDARPYRMDLPASLHWVEVDFPEIIFGKEDILRGDTPKCRLQRIALDLSDSSARRQLFASLHDGAEKIAVVSEGLLIYFTAEEVAALGRDLAVHKSFAHWIVDLTSPGQLKLMQRTSGKHLSAANAAFKFAPPEGPAFFHPIGWQPQDVQGMLKTAAEFHRAPEGLLELLPEPKRIPPNYPWTGVCLLNRVEGAHVPA